MNLLTTANTKTVKGASLGYLTGILHLAPGKLAKRGNVCPMATGGRNGCLRVCINETGKGRFTTTQAARIRRTRLMFDRPRMFSAMIVGDLAELVRQAEEAKLAPAVRLNGTSDVDWRSDFPEVMDAARSLGLVVYDYTKRFELLGRGPGYDLTFSRSGRNDAACLAALKMGHRVAVVFRGELPPSFWGHPVVNGDAHDLRFLDPSPCVVGLSAKGQAKTAPKGFVVEP